MHGPDPAVLAREAMMALTVVIVAAKLGGEFFSRLGQPPVLGELVIGMALGNLPWFLALKTSTAIAVVAEIGVILLLFEVGLESDLHKMLAVGWSALLVACLGVVAPMALGYGVSALLLSQEGPLTHLFVGATLTATSVGITARVLKDLNVADTKEARIILGAAVADDVIGLVVLAVVSGLAAATAGSGAGFTWSSTLWIVAKAALFLTLAMLAGRFLAQRMFRYAARLRIPGVLAAVSICFCFVTAMLAARVGLAPIVGAFAAGLVLDPVHYQPFLDRGERRVEDLLFPITTLIAPVFFVLMGLRVDLSGFASAPVAAFTALVTLAAVAGKQICALGVLERGVDRLAVGVGMIPRGEVGLIFASIGAGLVVAGRPLFSTATLSALVAMVMLTTLVTPPLLKVVFVRRAKDRGVVV